MSLFDLLNIKKRSTRRLIGIKNIDNKSIELYNGNTLVMFRVRPSNISTLSKDMLETTIKRLFVVIKSIEQIEFSLFDTAESYGANKEYLTRREAEEENPIIKAMIHRESLFLDNMKANTATGKEFLIQLRFNENDTKQIVSLTRHVEKILKDNYFSPVLLTKEQYKYAFAVYYEKNMTREKFADFDGGELGLEG